MKQISSKSQALLIPEEQGRGWGLFSMGQATVAQDKCMETQLSKGSSDAGHT